MNINCALNERGKLSYLFVKDVLLDLLYYIFITNYSRLS